MAEEKKKGFWSWLGFGKKENAEPVVAEETTSETQSETEAETEAKIDTETAAEIDVEVKVETETEAETHSEPEAIQPAEIAEPLAPQAVTLAAEIAPEESLETPVAEVPAEEIQTVEMPEEENQAEEIAPQAVENDEKITAEGEMASGEDVEKAEAEKTEKNTACDPYQEKPANEGGFFSRLIKGLIKTKESIGSGFRHFFRGKKIDDELFEELEEQLLIADLGMPTTTKIIQNLTQHASKQQLRDAELLYQQLKLELADVLKPVAQPLVLSEKKPYVILMVGVNGVGKTTTIGKLARKFQAEGKSVMLAAGDTFRAAAVEQLQVWGERNQIPVVAQATGADSASVIFDAMQSAAAKGVDVLIADTAGRLQNKNNLMDELKKIVRVMKKYDETAPHEIMLTLDAGTGQNAISQAKLFNEAVGLTGITLTKLDGTAKGGVIFAIADQFNIPIRFIGVGEKIDDLRPFNADEFIDALFAHEDDK